jgi:hypothetical protein
MIPYGFDLALAQHYIAHDSYICEYITYKCETTLSLSFFFFLVWDSLYSMLFKTFHFKNIHKMQNNIYI